MSDTQPKSKSAFSSMLEAESDAQTATDAIDNLTCVDAVDWLNQPDEPDRPLIHGLVESGEMVAVVGQSKAGKSFITLQMAVCIALGLPFLGRMTERRRVYVANLEVSCKQYKKRLRRLVSAIGASFEQLKGWLFIDNLKGEEATWGKCRASAKARGCEVALLDPFYQIFKGVEKDEEACNEAISEMKKFQKDGITLFVVFHSPKGFSGDRQLIDMISGSSILARFPESIFGILNHATDDDCRVCKCVLRNYAPPEDQTIRFNDGLFVVDDETSPDVATAQNHLQRAKVSAPPLNVLPYVTQAIAQARADAEECGRDFKGITKGALIAMIRQRIQAEEKRIVGVNNLGNLIEALPPSQIIITSKTSKGVLIGRPDDMGWYMGR